MHDYTITTGQTPMYYHRQSDKTPTAVEPVCSKCVS